MSSHQHTRDSFRKVVVRCESISVTDLFHLSLPCSHPQSHLRHCSASPITMALFYRYFLNWCSYLLTMCQLIFKYTQLITADLERILWYPIPILRYLPENKSLNISYVLYLTKPIINTPIVFYSIRHIEWITLYLAELTRLHNVFGLVPNLHWIIVEDARYIPTKIIAIHRKST